ncbi:MAG TPA: ABC transporter permease [Kribbellaceae bacterium]|jgi:peptide/nickel transport system permease protein
MVGYVARRLAFAIGTVAAASVLSFLLVHLTSGSPGAIVAGQGATPEQIDAANEELGWNRPLVTQFADWVSHVTRGDFGTSLSDGHDIKADLFARLPVTASIALLATLLSAIVGIVIGVTAAVRGGRLDRAVTAGSSIAVSLPAFWVGVLLVYALSIRTTLLPATGYVPFAENPVEWLKSLALPAIALAVGGAAIVARTARTGMVEALRQEHIRTLQAIGTPPWRLRYVHALRFASAPVVSVLGVQFIALFGGSIIVENLFALPGLGQATQLAVGVHDLPAVQGVVVIATVVVVITNLLLDLLVAALDPKVRTA